MPSSSSHHSQAASGKATGAPWKVISLAVLLLAIDFVVGPYIQFPIFFVIPVMLAAWFHGVGLAVTLALAMAGARFFNNWAWHFPFNVMPAMANTVMRGLMLALIAYVTARTALQVRTLRKRILQLEARLPVCRACGVIEETDGKWVDLSSQPTPKNNCLCPACADKNYGAFS